MPAPIDPIQKAKWLERLKNPSLLHRQRNSIGVKKFWASEQGILLKRKFSEERKGKPRSQETKKKIQIANTGRKYSKEINLKKGRKGRVGPNKGRINPDSRIRIFFEKLDQRYSKKQEFIDKHKGVRNPMYGKKRPEISILMSRLATTRKYPFKNSKPERMMQLTLSLHGILFETHKVISCNNGFTHCVDIFIKPNICLEVDGKYFHTLPNQAQRDIIINHELMMAGYYVLRIWDTDIIKNTIKISDILNLIKQKQEFELKL